MKSLKPFWICAFKTVFEIDLRRDIMSTIKKFLKSSGIFLLGSTLSKLIVFFMIPIYTKYFPTNDYGYYDVSITYLSLVIAALFFEIWSTTLRFMCQSKEIAYKYKIISNGFFLLFLFMLLFTIGFVVLRITVQIKYLTLIYLYGVSLVFVNMQMFITRGMERNLDFAKSGIINTFFVALLNIVFIVLLRMNFAALYIAAVIGNILQIIFLEWKTRAIRNVQITEISVVVLKQMLKYTLPLCLSTTAYWVLSGYSRIVISNVMSLGINGIYAIGDKFSYVIVFATNCVTYAWQGVSFERDLYDRENGTFYSKAAMLYMQFLVIAVIVVLPLFKIFFPCFVDKAYLSAANLMPLFIINACMYSYTTFAGNIFAALKKTNVIFFTMGVSCAFHLLLSYPLIKLWGLNGINLSVFISYLVNILLGYLWLKRQMHFTVAGKQVLILFCLTCISLLVYFKLNPIANLIWLVLCGAVAGYLCRNHLKPIIVQIFRN
jgi:O-antigen/teichoic acid export membrane protein